MFKPIPDADEHDVLDVVVYERQGGHPNIRGTSGFRYCSLPLSASHTSVVDELSALRMHSQNYDQLLKC